MGSGRFLYVLAVFSVLTNALLVGLDLAFAHVFEDPSYIYTCAAGFSGVLFALKVITTYNQPSGYRRVLGVFPVPVRWAYWAELVAIQLLLPHVSFTGHLAGILVGLLYVKGPLKSIMDAVAGVGRLGECKHLSTFFYMAIDTMQCARPITLDKVMRLVGLVYIRKSWPRNLSPSSPSHPECTNYSYISL